MMYEKLLEIMEKVQYKRADMMEVLYKLWMATPPRDRICISEIEEYFVKEGEIPYALDSAEQSVVNRLEAWFRRRRRMTQSSDTEYRNFFIQGLGLLAYAAHYSNEHLIDTYSMMWMFQLLTGEQ